jgi:hypothetical protein
VVVLLGRWNWWPAPLFRHADTGALAEAQTDQNGSMTAP